MILSRPRSLLAGAVFAALGSGLAGAQETAPSAVEQRLHEEMQSMLVRLVETGALQDGAQAVALSAPAAQQPDFGAILDVRHRATDAGLPVLGVTPGGSAARLGVLPGDRLLAINGTSLAGLGADADGRAVAAGTLRDGLLANSGAIELSVARGDGVQVLRGTVAVVQVPAYRLELGTAIASSTLAAPSGGDGVSACGRISIIDIAPRRQQLYRAVLIAVDGELPGPTSSEVHRLTPGKHVLRVAEAIDPKQFDNVQRLTRDRRRGDDHYKELEIDVQPGVTYRLAARFNYDQRGSIRDGRYWDPVIWTEVAEACR